MWPAVRDEIFSSFSQIEAENLPNSDCRYLLACHQTSSELSPRLVALEVVVPDITTNVASGDDPNVESLTFEMLGLQNLICQRVAEVQVLEGRLRQQDAEVHELRGRLHQRDA